MNFLSQIKSRLRRMRLAHRAPKDIFAEYARHNKWGDRESLSGKGSNLEATKHLRKILPAILRDLGVRSMIDVPCGDFFWMSQVDLAGINYIGGDIVQSLIDSNTAKHRADNLTFQVIDLIEGPIPKADLIFCRDCIVHLSNDHAARALASIARSGGTWLLTTTFPETGQNNDIATGEWRAIDLTKPPFNLPPPLRLIPEGQIDVKGQAPDKMLGLWRIADLERGKA